MRRTGCQANDAHTRYLQMGSPRDLGAAQLAELRALTQDKPETDRTIRVGADGRYSLNIPMRTNDVILAQIEPLKTATRK